MQADTATAMVGLAALVFWLALGLGVAIYWGWRSYATDRYRHELFVIRDELFDYAASGAIAFDHPAYTTLRQRLNVMLRYAHQASLLRGFIMIGVTKMFGVTHSPSLADRFVAALDSVETEDVRSRLADFESRYLRAFSRQMRRVSPGCFLMLIVVVAREAAPSRDLQEAAARERLPYIEDHAKHACAAA